MANKVDIVFVVPSSRPRMKEESMGTLILAKKLQLAGFCVEIARYWNAIHGPKDDYTFFCKELVEYICQFSPSVVSFYCRCEEYPICIDLSQRVKERMPKVVTAFGGPQAELVARETLERFSSVDYVCCSEGENTIVPFMKFITRNDGTILPSSIPGLTYRDEDGTVKQNRFPDFLPDNYCRPFLYYDLLPDSVLNDCKGMPIDVGRGCPFSCTYCSTKTFWKRKFRLRNLSDIVDEMEYVASHFGITSFDFMHDLFTVNKRRIQDFCLEIAKRGLKVKWGCDSRIDTIDPEMVDLMVQNGLTQIFFGIETGSPRMQVLINKKLDLGRCDDIVKYCLSKGLKVTTSFIYGFPEETEEDLDLTLKMAVKFQNYGVNVLTNLCHIMNGTELFARYKDMLTIRRDIAYNSCIPAFDNLYEMIAQNKDMFANFCDFPNPYRDEMSYFDVFRYSLHYAYIQYPEAHESLKSFDYASLEMYRAFCNANLQIFAETVDGSDGDVNQIHRSLKRMPPDLYRLMINNLLQSLKSVV